MRILFISDNFPPEVNAPATRTYEHCKEWVDKGVDVTVITCAPNFPQGKVYEGHKNKWIQKDNLDGIRVIRVWSYISANKGMIRRTLDYLSFAFTSFVAGLFQKADVIIATSPQFFTTWSGFLLSKIKRKPWVFELRDLWPESIVAVGAIQNKKIINFLENIELGLYKSADIIVPNTQAFRENLISRNINADSIKVIPNGANLDLFTNGTVKKDLQADLKLEDKFVVGYLGTHGLAHGLDFILESAAKVKDPSIHFLFVGDGAEKNKLIVFAEDHYMKNVTFLPSIPKEEVPAYLEIFDVALVPLKKNDTFKTVIPSKIFEAAALHIPVLLGVEGEAQKLIEDYNAGICFEPENEKDFLDKLSLIKGDQELYENLARGGQKLAEKFDRKILAEKMLNYIQKIAKNGVV